jgi:hypothetical protein
MLTSVLFVFINFNVCILSVFMLCILTVFMLCICLSIFGEKLYRAYVFVFVNIPNQKLAAL